jgi:hypothetical protein
MEEPDEASVKLADLLDLPALLAGSDSSSLTAALDKLGEFHPTPAEFGSLVEQAHMALDTVCSALLAMRDRALEREQHG